MTDERVPADVAGRLLKAAFLSGFVAGLDATSAFFIFPAIRSGLADGDTASASWFLTIVGIVSAAVLLQAGRLADRFGHNRILIVSAAGATAAALLAAAAPTLLLLVVAKGLHAGFLSGLAVSSIAIIVRVTPHERLATTLGTWAFWTALSGVVGPLLASGLVEVSTWRFMFLATAAAAACVAVLGSVGWRSDFVRTDRAPIDYVGTVSAMAGLSLVVLTLLEGNHWGWSSPRTIGSLLVGVALVSFVLFRSRTQADPTVPLDLFRNRNFALSAAIGFTSSMMFYGMWLALLSYATDVWDQGLIRTGLMLTLMPGTMLFFARAAGRAADARGYRGVMMTGTTIFCAGFTTFALTAGEDTNNLLLLPAVISAGMAMASVVSNTTSVGTRTLAPTVVGTGTAILQTFHRVGGSLGSALVVALLETGQIGEPGTNRRPVWALVVLGAIVLVLCSFLSSTTAPSSATHVVRGAESKRRLSSAGDVEL